MQPKPVVDPQAESRLRHLHALLDLSKAMAREIQLDALLPLIMQKTTEMLDADRSTLFLYDPDHDELWSKVAQGLRPGEIRFPASQGIAGFVARNREILRIRDAYSDPRFNPTVDRETAYRTRSILCAPVINSRSELVGVIEALNKRTSPGFDEEDEELMEALAAHVCVALERAYLVERFAEQERLHEALRLAREIQESMLPDGRPENLGGKRIEVGARMLPAREVGGDFYDYLDVGEHAFAFSIGDVSGKGIPAALFMAVSRSVIRSFMLAGLSPDECLRQANALLYPECPRSMFVTAIVGSLDLQTGEVTYSIAGHPPPYLLRAGHAPRSLDPTGGLGLCMHPHFRYAPRTLTLEPGEALFFFTDGLTEARNRAGEMFDDERVAACLDRVVGGSAEGTIRQVHDAVEIFTDGAPRSDDLTTLVVRYLGP